MLYKGTHIAVQNSCILYIVLEYTQYFICLSENAFVVFVKMKMSLVLEELHSRFTGAANTISILISIL